MTLIGGLERSKKMSNYERLTTKADEGNVFDNIVFCLNCPNKTEKYRCKNNSKNCFKAVINRLAELEDKIENGTLIELPCKVGDIFYGIETNTIFKYSVIAIKIVENNAIHLSTVYDIEFVLGKDAFLTKAEAEQKLKELKGEV